MVEDSLPFLEMKNIDNLETQPMMFQIQHGQTHIEIFDDDLLPPDDLSAQPLTDHDPSHGERAHEELCPSQVPGSDPAQVAPEELCPSQDRGSAELSATSGNHSNGVGNDPKGSSCDIKDVPPKPSKSKKVLPPVPVMTPSEDTSHIPVPRTHSHESLA